MKIFQTVCLNGEELQECLVMENTGKGILWWHDNCFPNKLDVIEFVS